MPTTPISMRKLKEILRLKYGAKLSHRQIAGSLSISSSSDSTYANRAAQLGIVDWPLDTKWDDVALKRAFFNTQVKTKQYALPCWLDIKQSLTSKIMTLLLLWEEYAQANPQGHCSYHQSHQYPWSGLLSLRRTHEPITSTTGATETQWCESGAETAGTPRQPVLRAKLRRTPQLTSDT